MPEIEGVGPEAKVIENEHGGRQSEAVGYFHLLDPISLVRMAGRARYGVVERGYPRDNWRRISCEEHLNHALNHIMAFMAGDTQDDHLAAAMLRIHFADAKRGDGSVEAAIRSREANSVEFADE